MPWTVIDTRVAVRWPVTWMPVRVVLAQSVAAVVAVLIPSERLAW